VTVLETRLSKTHPPHNNVTISLCTRRIKMLPKKNLTEHVENITSIVSVQFPFLDPCSFPISLSTSVNILSYCHRKNKNVATKELNQKKKTLNNIIKYTAKKGLA
jgi:hypothetical protein